MSVSLPTTAQDQIRAALDRRDYRSAHVQLRALRGLLSESDRISNVVDSCECLVFLGHPSSAAKLLAQVCSQLRNTDRHDSFARSCMVLAISQCYFLGRLDEARENASMALYTFKRVCGVAGIARTLNLLSNIDYLRGDYRQSIIHSNECEKLAAQSDLSRWVAVSRYNLASVYLKVGDLQRSRTMMAGLAERFSAMGDRTNGGRLEMTQCSLLIHSREFDLADAILQRSKPVRGMCAYPFEPGIWHEYMGELLLARGQFEAARLNLQRAIEIANTVADDSLLAQSRRLLAEVRLAEGDAEAALEEAARARVSIDKVGERFEDGAVHRVIGEAHARLGNTKAAREAFRHAIDVLQMIGARLEWARACLSAGRCTLFDDRERLGYLVEADRLFAEIGVEYWIAETRSVLNEILYREAPHTGGTRQPASVRDTQTIIATDPTMRQVLIMAGRMAESDIAVLISGETGTGKDVLARYIHDRSPRGQRPFVPIDLATIPESLLESELFGHCKGTFTGAREKQGLLGSADGGTVFLNEIGNIPLSLQAKLLEFLQSRRVRRLGETTSTTLDVRVVAATNADLSKAVAAGTFRDDLYFRLAQAGIALPPLRERPSDILPLIRHFLIEFGMSEARAVMLPAQPWVALARTHSWPGNIRQLRNFLWSLTTIAGTANAPDLFDLAENFIGLIDNGNLSEGSSPISEIELRGALERHNGNQRATARDLRVSEATVRNWMRRFRIR